MQTIRIDSLSTNAELHSYRINQVLGSGAFGITYLATHRYLDTQHVIKEYLPDCGMREHNRSTVSPKSSSDKDLFDWGLKCFFDEAKLLHRLSHPHVVKVTDLFEANSTAYFVMPYLRGITLHEWMKSHPQPSQDELEAIFVPLLEGLKYIHDKNLLHRDIKPENIFITERGNPILIDFGSARMAIGQKSRALTQVLTPHFAPIEQYRTKGIFTPALDLYSLVACMYRAITGKMPEEAPNRLETDEQHKLAGSDYEKRYAAHFLQAIDKGLSLYAKDRYQNGFDLQKDLVGFDENYLMETLKIEYANEAEINTICTRIPVNCVDHQVINDNIELLDKNNHKKIEDQKVINLSIQKYNILYEHTHWVMSVCFSNDGNAVASGGKDNIVKLYNILDDTVKKFIGHIDHVLCVKITPDGKKIISGSKDKTIKIWNVDTENSINTLYGHDDLVMSLDYFHDKNIIVSGSDDKTIKLWDIHNGKVMMNIEGHQSGVWSVRFSPDGEKILSCSADKTVKLWDVPTGKELLKLEGHKSWVTSVDFCADGTKAISGSLDKTIKIWNLKNGSEIHTFTGHTDCVTSVCWDKKTSLAISGSQDKTIKLWDVGDNKCVYTYSGHKAAIRSVNFSPVENFFISGSDDTKLMIWSIKNEIKNNNNIERIYKKRNDNQIKATAKIEKKFYTPKIFNGHNGWVMSISFSPDGLTAISGGRDGTLILWDVHTGRIINSFCGHLGGIRSVSYCQDGQSVVSGSEDGTIKIWSLKSKKNIRTLHAHNGIVTGLSVDNSGNNIVSSSADRTIKLWQVSTGKHVRSFLGHLDVVSSISFNNECTQIVSGSFDKTVRIWNVLDETEQCCLKGHNNKVSSVLFVNKGTSCISVSRDKTFKVWDIKNKKILFDFSTNHQVFVAILVDNKLITAGKSKKISFFDVNDYEKVNSLNVKLQDIYSIAISPNKNSLLIGGRDCNIYMICTNLN
jgi:WD40 repeat protein